MQALKITFYILCGLSTVSTEARELNLIRQVIAESITIDSKDGAGKVILVKGQVVEVKEQNTETALVREIYTGTFASIPRKLLVTAADFQPISVWHGEQSLEWASESYDSGITYRIESNGTFKATYDDNREPYSWTGHLYRKGDLVWAKPDNLQQPTLSEQSVFKINLKNESCYVTSSEKVCCYSNRQENFCEK